jgi:hypothetical protein
MPEAVRVIHSLCGGIAFWYAELPVGSKIVLDPHKVLLNDGRKVTQDDPVICGHCENPVGTQHMEFTIEDSRLR